MSVAADARPSPLERLSAAIARFDWVKRVWLYGSRAEGRAHPLSDFDLAIEGDPPGLLAHTAFIDALEEATLYPLDVSWWSDLSPMRQAQIRQNGKLIHDRSA